MNISKLFLGSTTTLLEHYKAQNERTTDYISNYLLITEKYKMELTILRKAQILAIAMARNDRLFTEYLLRNTDLPTILKTCQILDSGRLARQMDRKTTQITNKKRLASHKSIISNLKSLNEGLELSLTGAKIKNIIKWCIKSLNAAELELLALQLPKSQWKKLANLLHTKDTDYPLDWFNSYIFDKPIHDTTSVAQFAALKDTDPTEHASQLLNLVKTFQPSYAWLKSSFKKSITPELLHVIAQYEKPEQLLHHWETFESEHDLIVQRFKKEAYELSYGTLMRHLLYLDPELGISKLLADHAQQCLANYSYLTVDQPVLVLADASASMDVAIRVSTIISSVLCSLFTAELRLFRNDDQLIDPPPRSVTDVLRLGRELRAGRSTAPSASLKPLLDEKRIVKTIIIVTDEEENTDYNGEWSRDPTRLFAGVYKEYHDTVYPARLIFVSFLSSPGDGQMVRALKEIMPEAPITQFWMDRYKPDLRKLDSILNQMTITTLQFENDVAEMKKQDFTTLFKSTENKPDTMDEKQNCNIS